MRVVEQRAKIQAQIARVDAFRAGLDHRKVLPRGRKGGEHCAGCVHFERPPRALRSDPICHHPVCADVVFSPVSGVFSCNPGSARWHRSDKGLCGPEGMLFETGTLRPRPWRWDEFLEDLRPGIIALALFGALSLWAYLWFYVSV